MDEKIDQSQVERFKEIARMMECDEDEGRFAERLRKVAGQKPELKPE
jgi:Asp-tRNA(Asn)/Glu-tRNA(Gln) amidotransferase C subunit